MSFAKKGLGEWIQEQEIGDLVTAEVLREQGFECANNLCDLPDEDNKELCKELGLKFGKKGRFLTAIDQLRLALSPPPSSPKRVPGMPVLKKVKRRKKRLKLNIMIAGEAGLGKTTFMQSAMVYETIFQYKQTGAPPEKFRELFRNKGERIKQLFAEHYGEEAPKSGAKTPDIKELQKPIEMVTGDPDVILEINYVDTPGYADGAGGAHFREEVNRLVKETEDRLDRYKSQKLKMVPQSQMLDERIHMIFLFLRPRIKACDQYFVEKLSPYAPIVPIAAQADHLSSFERVEMLQAVQEQLAPVYQRVKNIGVKEEGFFDLENLRYTKDKPSLFFVGASFRGRDGIDEDEMAAAGSGQQSVFRAAKAGLGSPNLQVPAAIGAKKKRHRRHTSISAPIGGRVATSECEEIYRQAFQRDYPWGVYEVLNQEHSDFTKLVHLIRENCLLFDTDITDAKFRWYCLEFSDKQYLQSNETSNEAFHVQDRLTTWRKEIETAESAEARKMPEGLDDLVAEFAAVRDQYNQQRVAFDSYKGLCDGTDSESTLKLTALSKPLEETDKKLKQLIERAERHEELKMGPNKLLKAWGAQKVVQRYQRLLKKTVSNKWMRLVKQRKDRTEKDGNFGDDADVQELISENHDMKNQLKQITRDCREARRGEADAQNARNEALMNFEAAQTTITALSEQIREQENALGKGYDGAEGATDGAAAANQSIQNFQRRNTELEGNLNALREAQAQEAEQARRTSEELNELREARAQEAEQFAVCTEELKQFSRQNSELQASNASNTELQASNADLEAANAALQASYADLQASNAGLKESNATLQEKVSTASEKTAGAEGADQSQKVGKLTRQLTSERKRTNQLEAQVNEVKEQSKGHLIKNSQYQKELGHANTKIKGLEMTLNSLRKGAGLSGADDDARSTSSAKSAKEKGAEKASPSPTKTQFVPGGFEVGDTVYALQMLKSNDDKTTVEKGERGRVAGPDSQGRNADQLVVVFSEKKKWVVFPKSISKDRPGTGGRKKGRKKQKRRYVKKQAGSAANDG